MTPPAASRPTRESRIRRAAPAPAVAAKSDWFRWLGLALGAFPLTAILYAVGRLVYTSSYRVFGLTPEDVGLTQTRIVGQAAGTTGFLTAFLGSVALVAWAQWLLMRSTEPEFRRAPAPSAKAGFAQGVVVLVPLLAAVFVPLAVPGGWRRSAVELALFTGAAGVWWSAAAGWTAKAFVAGAVFVGGLGGILYATTLEEHAFRSAFKWMLFAVAGLTAAFLNTVPRFERLRVTLVRSSLLALCVWAALIASGSLQTWLVGTAFVLATTWMGAAVWAGGSITAVLDRRASGWRVVAGFVAVGFVLAVGALLVEQQQNSGIAHAVAIRQGGSARGSSVFPIESVPARLVSVNNDPLGLCAKRLVARLLGRNGDTAFVLFRPPEPGPMGESFVVPLAASDYVVVTGFRDPGLCEPL